MTTRSQQRGKNRLYWVKDNILSDQFPKVSDALRDPDGLLAIGGDLGIERLLEAYQSGIFPWFNEGQPILWWSPNPRCVLEMEDFKISRSLRKRLRQKKFTVTFNKAFDDVLMACAEPRKDISETWITEQMKRVYSQLHASGYAHSVEAWSDDKLVGGLYGVSLGQIFFGESMFSRVTDASKVALTHLVHETKLRNFRLIDCQVHSYHLQSLGAKPIPREMFINILEHYCSRQKTLHWPAISELYDV